MQNLNFSLSYIIVKSVLKATSPVTWPCYSAVIPETQRASLSPLHCVSRL